MGWMTDGIVFMLGVMIGAAIAFLFMAFVVGLDD